MTDLVDCSDVYVKKSGSGFRVYARRDFSPGEIIEKGIMYRVENGDWNSNPYVFTWSEDTTVWACGSGCLPFYNHSVTPNVLQKPDFVNDSVIVIALDEIKKDTELVNTYYAKKWGRSFQEFM